MRPIAIALCASFIAAASDRTHENLNAVLWVQTAAEYRAIALQTYRAAEINLQRALADKRWTAALEQTGDYSNQPPAVILDLDETVLDNSAYQARLTADNKPFTLEGWSKWEAEGKAGLVPGAREFLTVAHANGVALCFVTNRVCDASKPDDPTLRLLQSLHVPSGQLLCKSSPTDSSDKSPRRARVASRYRVLLLIGDDFNDFLTLPKEQSTVKGRQNAVDAFSRYWGERWFALPNPTYGSWERAVGLDVKAKRSALRR
jgi:acid phosphatase